LARETPEGDRSALACLVETLQQQQALIDRLSITTRRAFLGCFDEAGAPQPCPADRPNQSTKYAFPSEPHDQSAP